jgi:acetyl esterase/lipase
MGRRWLSACSRIDFAPGQCIRAAVWGALLIISSALVADDVQRSGVPEGVEAYRDIVYRKHGGREIRLDVYVPQGAAPRGGRPTILAIHGGGWSGGSKNGYGRMVAEFARRGYVVVSVAYLLARPSAPSWPHNFEDIREAVRWVRGHSKEYGIDPNRLVAMGASAGGHLASLLGTYPDGPVIADAIPDTPQEPTGAASSVRVQAVIDFYGPTDLTALLGGRQGAGGPLDLFLGGTPATVPGRYLAASPLSHVTRDDPPHLIVHGSLDWLVPSEQSRRLTEALKATGVRHKLIIIDGAGHGFGLKVRDRDLTPEILAFLAETWDHKRDDP